MNSRRDKRDAGTPAPAVDPPAEPDAGIPPLLPPGDPRSRTFLVSLLGLAPDARGEAIARFAAEAEPSGESPIFLTDDPDFSEFAGSGHFYEYIPPIEEQVRHASGRRWDLYIAEKMKVILAKWRPTRVECAGLPIPDFIRKVAEAHRHKATEF